MAWEITAYGVTVAVLAIATAFVIGIVRTFRSLRGLDRSVERLSKETEASLLACRHLAEEAKETIILSKQCVQGLSTFVEGVQAIGVATKTAADAVAQVTSTYRERLTSTINQPDWTDIGRNLWLLWRRRSEEKPSASSNRNPGPSADPSQGE